MCHSSLKPISDEEDTLSSFFMTFDIEPREPVFRAVIGNQIVVLLTIPLHIDTPLTRIDDIGYDTWYHKKVL